jgi:cell division septum initiation protein DivIVA
MKANDLPELLHENEQLREQVEILQQRLRQITDEVASLSAVVVAGATLHATTDRISVVSAIEQIMLNLIGSDKFALFQIDGGNWQLMHCLGVEPAMALEYVAGSALVAQSVQSGDTWAAPTDHDEVLACVPILTQRRVSAVIVIFDLLPQKRRFVSSDFDVFELLTSQAGAVLQAAGHHETRNLP